MFSYSQLSLLQDVPVLGRSAWGSTWWGSTWFLLPRSSKPQAQTTEAHSFLWKVLSTGHPIRAEKSSVTAGPGKQPGSPRPRPPPV